MLLLQTISICFIFLATAICLFEYTKFRKLSNNPSYGTSPDPLETAGLNKILGAILSFLISFFILLLSLTLSFSTE